MKRTKLEYANHLRVDRPVGNVFSRVGGTSPPHGWKRFAPSAWGLGLDGTEFLVSRVRGSDGLVHYVAPKIFFV